MRESWGETCKTCAHHQHRSGECKARYPVTFRPGEPGDPCHCTHQAFHDDYVAPHDPVKDPTVSTVSFTITHTCTDGEEHNVLENDTDEDGVVWSRCARCDSSFTIRLKAGPYVSDIGARLPVHIERRT